MTIQKSSFQAGMYECFGYVKGTFFVGSGHSTREALTSCFQKIMWVNN